MKELESLNDLYPIYRIGLTIIVFLFYLLLRKFSSRSIIKRAIAFRFDDERSIYIRRVVRMTIFLAFVVVLGVIWEVSLKGLSLYIASFITIVGVGLFANWSIVSNITASVILFFFFPFKIGSKVKILDGDNSVQGTVIGLSLFSICIKTDEDTEVYFPNNLAIQKGIVNLGKHNDV